VLLQVTPMASMMASVMLASLGRIEHNCQDKQQAELVCHGLWQPPTAAAQAEPAESSRPQLRKPVSRHRHLSHIYVCSNLQPWKPLEMLLFNCDLLICWLWQPEVAVWSTVI
jgi:hypothetical protein